MPTREQRFTKALARPASRHTRKLIKQALGESPIPAHIEVKVWGKIKAEAYMLIGWSPVSQSYEAGCEVYSLRMDTPNMEW